MEAVAINRVEKDPNFYKLYKTTEDHANFEVQLRHGCPNIHHSNTKVETDAIAVYARKKLHHWP
eukprot:3838659-Ditylum_brightwellii.AAC.1